MTSTRTERTTVPTGSGRLAWEKLGDDLVAGPYRVRMLAPGRWEAVYRDRRLGVLGRRSMAVARAEHHRYDTRVIRRAWLWGLTAGLSLAVAAVVVRTGWITHLIGFAVFVVAAGVFLGSLVRSYASASRNLLDPYRAREAGDRVETWDG